MIRLPAEDHISFAVSCSSSYNACIERRGQDLEFTLLVDPQV